MVSGVRAAWTLGRLGADLASTYVFLPPKRLETTKKIATIATATTTNKYCGFIRIKLPSNAPIRPRESQTADYARPRIPDSGPM